MQGIEYILCLFISSSKEQLSHFKLLYINLAKYYFAFRYFIVVMTGMCPLLVQILYRYYQNFLQLII